MTAAELRALIAKDVDGGFFVCIADLRKFAELLEAEEAVGTITWVHDDEFDDTTDFNAVKGGKVVGWVFRHPDGNWFGNAMDGIREHYYPTEAEARAAVEDAVRAGR